LRGLILDIQESPHTAVALIPRQPRSTLRPNMVVVHSGNVADAAAIIPALSQE
jgi:hypothetical protein